MKRALACLSLAVCLGLTTGAMATEQGHVPPKVRAEMEKLVKRGVRGVTAIAMKDGKELYRLDLGEAGPDTQYPVASASKWMTAALVLTVVDEGKLSLTAPVSRYLPFMQGEAGTMTLVEMLSHTAGTGTLRSFVDIRQDPRITLMQSAEEASKRRLDDPPGTVFKYGGWGFQISGALVEQATGERWAKLFQERIAGPLGMPHTYWEHLPTRGVSPEDTLNPLLQGGVVTTADDYMKFLTMLANGGVYNGHRILSQAAIDQMETARTIGLKMAFIPRGGRGMPVQYALGNWCQTWTKDGRCGLVSSPGAYGTYPWIDRDTGVYGIFFLKDRLPRVMPELKDALKATLAAAQ